MAEEILIVYATFPNADTARTIVATLVEEGLIACGNLIPNVESIYRWQGTVQAATEVFAIMKTTRSCLIPLAERYRAMHPYQVAEFLTVSVEDGLPDYVRWIEDTCANSPGVAAWERAAVR
jgi:periplasmic divalent cation tolerance protein